MRPEYSLIPLPGSAPRHLPHRLRTARPYPRRRITVRVVLRPATLPRQHRLMTRVERLKAGQARLPRRFSAAEFARLHLPEQRDRQRLAQWARAAGLEVVESSPMRPDLVLAGFSDRIEAAFGVELELFDTSRGPRRSHRGAVRLPEHLHHAVVGVLGLDELPRHRPLATTSQPGLSLNYSPLELAEYYRFPAGLTGRGHRIAILSFGGGYHRRDLERYFRGDLRLALPKVQSVEVARARNQPLALSRLRSVMADFQDRDATVSDLVQRHGARIVEQAKDTLEVTMDIQIAGAIAPQAAIDVVFSDPSAAGWYEAIYTALGVGPARCRPASVISISWGVAEQAWEGHLDVIDQALWAACLKGVTVVCASGDRGSTGDATTGRAEVDYPGSSPHVLSVGGTSLRRGAGGGPFEVVWNDSAHSLRGASGGGLSGHWSRPGFQRRIRMPRAGRRPAGLWTSDHHPPGAARRGVPDVAAVADYRGGYRVLVGGVETTGAGTSGGAPLWAGLVARLAEGIGRPLGWLNPRDLSPRISKGVSRHRPGRQPNVTGSRPLLPGPEGVGLLHRTGHATRRGAASRPEAPQPVGLVGPGQLRAIEPRQPPEHHRLFTLSGRALQSVAVQVYQVRDQAIHC